MADSAMFFMSVRQIVKYLYYYHKMVLQISELPIIFTSVFHRILDFKSGVEFLFRPFFYFMPVMPDKQLLIPKRIEQNINP